MSSENDASRHEVYSFASALRVQLDARGETVGECAEHLGVTYQTVKNALDGKSVNARFAVSAIDHFGLTNRPKVLREFLLSFLELQLGAEGERLLNAAELRRRTAR